MIDISGKVAPGAEVPAPGEDKKADKAAPEKAGQDAPAKKGKAKAGPEKADKAPTPRKATKDKAAGKTPKEQRDKVSQGKAAPEQPVAGGGSGPGSAPAAKSPDRSVYIPS